MVEALSDEMPLILAAQAGDVEARNKLLLRHYPLIRRVIIDYCGRENVDEYLFAGIMGFLKALKNYDGTKGFRLTTYAWYGVLYRVSSAYQREKKRRGREQRMSPEMLNSLEGTETGSEVDERDLKGSQTARLDPHFRALPARQRYILRRRLLDGWTLKQVAQTLNCSRERVRQLQLEAIAQMRMSVCL